ncbi:MAG: quinone-dependent dihydroorotate dehydrogenase, partial [Caulobacteraceae bacterium]
PVGLAAGFDKNGMVPDAMLAAGFGFVEVGTVTPRPQAGSPRPRLFRLTEDAAVINRMGFNNHGVEAMARRWARRRAETGPVGANIGANRDSADRLADYIVGLTTLWGSPDWFTINISSPNTPGLRALQGGNALEELLGRISEARQSLRGGAERQSPPRYDPPLFLKIAPDLTDAAVAAIVETTIRFGLDGLIVGNTTVERSLALRSRHRRQAGGLSGAPLMRPSTELLRRCHAAAAGRLLLIGVGGIATAADVLAKIRAGANAVQLYTALVYRGPDLARTLSGELAGRLRAEGFRSLGEAVGAG